MKYVRTKTLIIDLSRCSKIKEKEDRINLYYELKGGNYAYWTGIDKKDILKQSDTIESLCDRFIVESREDGNDFYEEFNSLWEMLRSDFYQKYREYYYFYGAIWVKGKGLIYVAFVDGKGELELL